jgi:O-antigen ligase
MFANFLLVAVCLLLGLGWQGRSAQRACIASLLVIGVGMVPTLTPGLGGLPLAVGVAGWWWWRRHAPMRARIALVAGLLPALFMLLVASRSLLSPLDTPSQRWLLWSDALATIWTNPWRGIGLGQDVVGVSYLDPSGGQQWLTDAHNIVLNVTGQAGMPALLAFVGLCVWLCWRGLRPARAGNGVAAGALLALGVAVFYDGLTGSFEDARHVWVLVGLLAGAALACPPWMQPPPSTR